MVSGLAQPDEPARAAAAARPRDRIARTALVWAPPVLVALGVVANAAPGLMPGVGFWDTGEFQTVLPVLGTAHPTGYPTYVLLGFVANLLLAPFGEPAFRINLLSLLAIAAASAATVVLMRRLTGSIAIAVATGVALALTPDVWADATRADPHPIHLAFVAILLVVLVTWEARRRAGAPDADRWLVVAALAFGLAAANHSLTLLLAPPIVLYVLATEPRIVFRPKLLAACAAVLVATLVVVYLELPLRAGPFRAPLVYGTPDTWNGFWYVALAEQFRGSLSDPLGNLPHKLGVVGDLAWSQFGLVAPLLVPAYLATVRKAPRYALLTGSAMLLTLLFNTSYTNADISRYYLGPILWAWTWLGVLAAFLVELVADVVRSSRIAPPRIAPFVAAGLSVALGVAIVAPGIAASSMSRRAADRSSDISAQLWLDEALPVFARDAVVVSWWSTSTPLWYAQDVEGLRPDIFIVDDRTILDRDFGSATGVVDRYFGQRPVYVIRLNDHDLGLILAHYQLTQLVGSGSDAVYQVVARKGATG
jgi:Protein of unknown function (DUF2723)